MDLMLKDRLAIVGGASMGIGYGIARTLAGEGAKVAISARREPALREAADRIKADTGAEVLPIQADCRRAEDCKRLVETAVSALGGLDILVNNDGAPPLGDILTFDDAAWHNAIEQNFMYVVRMVREAAPHMRARHGGGIVNISALSALQPFAGFALSVASWGGVIGYAKTLSIELAPFGINVNTICPGYIDTTRLEKVFSAGGSDSEKMRAELTSQIPMGRIGSVDDVAALVALLVSARGNYITGTTIQVDGGLLRHVR
ncbi:MAG: SDR family oxidoreductase [Rhizobiales bacterium]|nr:SDR family oxidoreductase [Hyphomicrobiales bacterium]